MRMASTCAARVPSLRWALQHGWVGSWVSVRPTKCSTSGGHAVVCAAVSFRPCIDIHKYVFSDGKMNTERLRKLVELVGKQRLVLDLSCRKKDGRYTIVTDRWQKFSDVFVDEPTLEYLAAFADEFLVHGVDVEGKRLGIDEELVELLGHYSPIPVTYAGGVSTMDDLERIKKAGKSRVDATVGSALDIFGGDLSYKDVVLWHRKQSMIGQV